ncbi:hypothetical protein TNCV_1794071 [Trichonephila clavipes]|nr:hypothetical protein TNCV_1794071 [Trichonephila clavipes]
MHILSMKSCGNLETNELTQMSFSSLDCSSKLQSPSSLALVWLQRMISELIALRRSLQFACETEIQFQDVLTLTDNRASIQHLPNWTSIGYQTGLDILNLLGSISSNHRVHFHWVPSLVGIHEDVSGVPLELFRVGLFCLHLDLFGI